MFLIFIAFVFIANVFSEETTTPDIFQEVKQSRNFTDKVILVTGSTSGIGEQTVKLFSALGASVVVTGRKADIVAKVAQEVKQLSPHELEPLQVVADLTKYEDLEHLINKTRDMFGKLDVLVNNAGTFTIESVTDDNFMKDFDDFQNIDVRATIQLTRLAIPLLKKSKGNIINISSALTRTPQKSMLAYEVGKQALEMITKVLSLELGANGVRVNTISPGSIDTHPVDNATKDRIIKHTPLSRLGLPIDIAKGIAFLASTDAEFITGANLVIDGGIHYNVQANFMTSNSD